MLHKLEVFTHAKQLQNETKYRYVFYVKLSGELAGYASIVHRTFPENDPYIQSAAYRKLQATTLARIHVYLHVV
jgi:hypothetical protein